MTTFEDPERKKKLIATAAVLGAALVVVLGVELTALDDIVVSVSEEAVAIERGDHVLTLAEITRVEVRATMPEVGGKVRGRDSLLFAVKKGRFHLEGEGEKRIYLRSYDGPFLFLHTADDYVVLSFVDPERAEALARELEAKRASGVRTR